MIDENREQKMKTKKDSKANVGQKTPAIFEDIIVNTKIKLSLLWVALMFFYVYNDILSFFQPGTVSQLETGTIEGMEMTQMFLLGGAVLMSLPSIMIILSASLPAGTNRKVNLGGGVFHMIILSIPLLAPGGLWAFYAFNMFAELVVLILIVWTAWNWPRQDQ